MDRIELECLSALMNNGILSSSSLINQVLEQSGQNIEGKNQLALSF